MLWNELVKIALLGTDRASLSPESLQRLEELGVDTSEVAERVVLEGAAIAGPLHKAATPLSKWEAPLPTASQPSELKSASRPIAELLSQIIRWENDSLLKDCLSQLAHANRQLPMEHLPFLIEKALQKPAFWKLLEPTWGNRGEWVILQHPEWRRQIEIPQYSEWAAGNKEKRRTLLRLIRERDPEEGLELLQSEWENETYTDKAHFLKTLQAQLSPSDEAFLESCLDDRRKEVRKEAARLLTYLPDSALVARMKERMQALVQFKRAKGKKLALHLTLPDQYDDALIRDGLNLKLQWPKGGIHASRFWQMVAIIPPTHWTATFDLSPIELISLLPSSDWGGIFLQGIIEALSKHPDSVWITTIFEQWVKGYDDYPFWEKLDISPLLQHLSSALFNQIGLSLLKRTDESVSEQNPVVLFLQLEEQSWSEDLSKLVSKKIQQWIGSEGYGFHLTPHYKNILRRAGLSIPPKLHDSIRREWTYSSRYWPGWEREVQFFLATLGFRKKMYLAIHSD